ncbi:phosphohydrolase [Bradyrhizobium cosmicum]|uniref:phosphohydrolase n=1 Tax=Bradyrhizobium cosmicum TaxID=1404864 RepID=UPI001165A39F|nr:phosphohydrolase [Bradyrhizobium cosmicum]QDP20638.1 phosphohydrolase [Bradyrhizobium cosmicum]QDP20689.1 phosphohydrolase [Bradyrhizobium cosmicum]
MSRYAGWIQTYTGRQFWPLDPRPDDVVIEDIAHALAMQCRFGGHCLRFYSNAEHSVIVSRFSGDHALAGLLHDGSEAYLLDMLAPIKAYMPDYKAAEKRCQAAVYKAFGLANVTPPAVKRADVRLLKTERMQVMAQTNDDWVVDKEAPLDVQIVGWSPSVAEVAFIDRFRKLTRGRK